MDARLKEKLERFEKDENWSGMDPGSLVRVTEYTLKALYAYLDETGAYNEASIIGSALDCVETNLTEE